MADMKRSGGKNKISGITQQPLSALEWNFTAVPDDQLEACYLYEYAREFSKTSKHFKKFQKEWNHPANKPNGTYLMALGKIWDLLQAICKNFPYINLDYFPKTVWQDLPILPETAQRGFIINLRQEATEYVNGWASRHRKRHSDRLHIETLRQCEPPNIYSIEAFRDYHEFFHDTLSKQDLGNTEYGFFAIDWNFKNSQIIEALTDWLNNQREARKVIGLKEAKQTISRGAFRDKLNWLGALRVKNHYPYKDLVEYPDGRIKLNSNPLERAPYSHYPDLCKAARKAEQEIAKMFPKDWSEAEWKRKEQESEELRAKYGFRLPSLEELDSKANH